MCHRCACFTCCAVQYLAEAEGLKQLPMPPGGSNTRWPYWIDVAAWFMLVTVRYDNLLAFLLHTWLEAQGDAGISIQSPSASSSSSDGASGGGQPAALRGTELFEKIQLIKNDARRQFLEEMCDPALRVWLIFLALYGRMSDLGCSMKRFLNYTQNDKAGTAFKASCVVRSRLACLDEVASENGDPLAHPGFDELRTFVESRRDVYTDLDEVRKIVRAGAEEAAFYFRGENGAASTPRQQRALRWLNFAPLVVLGLMDNKGAVQAARVLRDLGRQGVKGYTQSMLPYMPDSCNLSELEEAILDATAGPCVAFQPRFRAVIEKLAGLDDESTTLDRLMLNEGELGDASRQLYSVLYELRFTPVGNFISETVVKTLEHGLHGTQRRTQAYATIMVAARHRPQEWPMTDSDYSQASKAIGTSNESRPAARRNLGLELQAVSTDSKMPDLEQEVLWLKDDELQEIEPDADEADEAATDDDRGGMAGCAQDPKV